MEEKNIKKLWSLCEIIRKFCESHTNCGFCPFYDHWDGCMIKDATEVHTTEFWELFPENIIQEDET